MPRSPRNIFWILIMFVAANTFLFWHVNRQPIFYQQGEITWHNIFWSSDLEQPYPFQYHLGIKAIDLKKIFFSSAIDTLGFRLRHFSYFADMISFKFWQWLEVASFRHYSLILLHLINAFITGQIVFRLTQNLSAGCLSGIILLNSSVAFTTLLFPFRIAKLLTITLFLVAWLILVSPKSFLSMPDRSKLIFSILILLGILTDEAMIFLIPILAIFLVLRDGKKAVFHKSMARHVAVYALSGCVIILGIFWLSARVNNPIAIGHLGEQWAKAKIYYGNLNFLRDSFYAFFWYFLRRNLGYWEFSLWGLIAAGSTVVLAYVLLQSKPSLFLKRLSIAILGILAIKAIILPHPSGLHPYIMPPGTTFPSLLFFSYYYTYIETTLYAIVLGLLLSDVIKTQRKALFAVIASVLFINYSNSVHANRGIVDLIAVHQPFWMPPHTAKSIIRIKEFLRETHGDSIYLSFPSGSEDIFIRRLLGISGQFETAYPREVQARLDLRFRDYASIIPVMFLRSIQNGKAITSLGNVPSSLGQATAEELSKSAYFLDVDRGELIDLKKIKEFYGEASFQPQIFTAEMRQKFFIQKNRYLIFFIKGAAQVNIHFGHQSSATRQTYGQSFQMFQFSFTEWDTPSLSGIIEVRPAFVDQKIVWVGPFILEEVPRIPAASSRREI